MAATISSSVTRRKRARILARDGARCFYCKRDFPPVELTMDHFIPKALGGTNHDHNIRLACSPCNQKKGTSLVDGAVVRPELSDFAKRTTRDVFDPADIPPLSPPLTISLGEKLDLVLQKNGKEALQ